MSDSKFSVARNGVEEKWEEEEFNNPVIIYSSPQSEHRSQSEVEHDNMSIGAEDQKEMARDRVKVAFLEADEVNKDEKFDEDILGTEKIKDPTYDTENTMPPDATKVSFFNYVDNEDDIDQLENDEVGDLSEELSVEEEDENDTLEQPVVELAPPCAPPPAVDDEEALTYLFFLRNCFLGCSAHGFPRAIEAPTKFRKIVWTTFTLCAIGAFFYQSYFLLSDYLSYQTSLSINVNLQTSMQFPSVTVCNMNKFRLSTLPDIDELENINNFELVLKQNMKKIADELLNNVEDETSQSEYTFMVLKVTEDQSLAIEVNDDRMLTLAPVDTSNPNQIFSLSPNTGSLFVNSTGFCVITLNNQEGDVLEAPPRSCEDSQNRFWIMRDVSSTAIYNSAGMAFQINQTVESGSPLVLAEQDNDEPLQLFTPETVAVIKQPQCLTHDGLVCRFPAYDKDWVKHKACSKGYDPDYENPFCPTSIDTKKKKVKDEGACNLELCIAEKFCPSNLPDVADYDYPGIGLIPEHFSVVAADAKKRARRSTITNGSSIASPLNPYVGMTCDDYTYDLVQAEWVATGSLKCTLPEKLLGVLTNLDSISTYSNYFMCDGTDDCYLGDDETIELCGNCSKNLFECNNGQCVGIDLRCDGFFHCTDGSDEFKEFCTPEDDKFSCATYNKLIDANRVCNTVVDCHRDLSDEVGIACDETYNGADSPDTALLACQSPEDGHWIAVFKSVLCDGMEQCLNGADEIACWKNSLDTWVDPFESLNAIYDGYVETVQSRPNDVKFYKMMSKNTTIQAGHVIDEMLVKCSFNNAACDKTNFVERISEAYGRCYQFNSEDPVFNSGKGYGLELLLNIEAYEYTGSMTENLGMAFFVSPASPARYLDPSTMLPVYPGMYTTIGVNKREILRLQPPYENCAEYSSSSLPFFNQNECLFICLQIAKLGRCGCSDSIEFSETLCQLENTDSRDCVKRVESTFLPGRDCDCPQECHSKLLDVTMEQSFWPNLHALPASILQTYEKINTSEGSQYIVDTITAFSSTATEQNALLRFRQNYAKANVYFKDLSLTTMETTPSNTFEGLVGGIGGLLGLWIGLSMLSICELFDVALDLYSLWLLREKREKYKHLENVEIPGNRPPPYSEGKPGQEQAGDQGVSDNASRPPGRSGRGRNRRKGGARGAMMMMSAGVSRGSNNAVGDSHLLYPSSAAAVHAASPAFNGSRENTLLFGSV